MKKIKQNQTFAPKNFNRREFVKASGILAAGLMMSPHLFAKNSFSLKAVNTQFPKTPIVPLFVLRSCERLGIGSDFFDAGLKHCLTSDTNHITAGNAFYMGPTVPFGKTELIQALENIKLKTEGNALDFGLSQRLAVVSGALVFQTTKDLFEENSTGETSTGNLFSEEQVYRDATVLRSFFTKGNPFNPGDAQKIESLFHEILPRTFVRFHTLMPDDYGWPDNIDLMLKNGADWIINMHKWREQTGSYFSALANAIANPDKMKVQKYIEQTNFFDKSDSMLGRVSQRNRVANIGRDEAANLIEQGNHESRCSQAIASGYQTLIGINDFLIGRIKVEDISEAMIGSIETMNKTE